MEKKITIEENQTIQINEVKLTEKAIREIDCIQQDSNGLLNDYINYVSDAVCFLGKTQLHFDDDFLTESQSLVQGLSYIHDFLRYLKTPIDIKGDTVK